MLWPHPAVRRFHCSRPLQHRPHIREMDDDYHSKSDNIDTQRLYLKDNLGVVSTVNPRDETVTQLLHNKPNTDELAANIALAEMDLTHFAPHLEKTATHCTPREDVIWPFFEPTVAITRLAIERAPDADPDPPSPTIYRSTCSSTPSPTWCRLRTKGHILLRVLPGHL